MRSALDGREHAKFRKLAKTLSRGGSKMILLHTTLLYTLRFVGYKFGKPTDARSINSTAHDVLTGTLVSVIRTRQQQLDQLSYGNCSSASCNPGYRPKPNAEELDCPDPQCGSLSNEWC